MTVAVVYSPEYLEHDEPTHPENAGRLRAIVELLRASGAWEEAELIAPSPLSEERLAHLHDPAYIAQVRELAARGPRYLDADTYLTPASYHIALLAAGGVVQAMEAVLDGDLQGALALVRPPGHHATPSRGMGFCLFNNVAIAARLALDERGLERVLIVDWDVHHGNGTQEAFYRDGRVLYFSTHQYPLYPGSGSVRETGAGAGAGRIVNVPLPPGIGDTGYRRVFEEVLLPVAERFRPELVFVSAGFDGHWADPLASMRLTVRGFAHLAARVRDISEAFCRGRLVLALEGGYHPHALAYGVLACFRVWQGHAPEEVEDPLGPPPGGQPRAVDPALEGVLAAVRRAHGLV
ncbi:MAG: histone deacetylase family protein [Chloroflexia bacterium]